MHGLQRAPTPPAEVALLERVVDHRVAEPEQRGGLPRTLRRATPRGIPVDDAAQRRRGIAAGVVERLVERGTRRPAPRPWSRGE